jgi:hypothetical protein
MSGKQPSAQLVLTLGPPLSDRIEAAARRRRMATGDNWTRSQVVRDMIEKALAAEEEPCPPTTS